MDANTKNPHYTGHLFTVEILIEESSNGLALEKLLHLLNTEAVKDYKIKSGIELGKLIEVNLQAQAKAAPAAANAEPKKEAAKKQPDAPAQAPKTAAPANGDIIEQLELFKQQNTLIRLTVVKGKGVKLNLPCRILNYDTSSQNVTVYHVDEKKVYLFKLNEIDDFIAG